MSILTVASTSSASSSWDAGVGMVVAGALITAFIVFLFYLMDNGEKPKSPPKNLPPQNYNPPNNSSKDREAQVQQRVKEIQSGLRKTPSNYHSNAPSRQEEINRRRREIEYSLDVKRKSHHYYEGGKYRVKPPSRSQISGFNLKQRIYGIPGVGLADSHFDDMSVSKGIIGEQKTADIIAKFIADTSETYAFHSLIWPMSYTDADVDHAIVCGDSILFIDSKNWQAKGVYAFNWEGDITLNDKPYKWGKQPKIIPAREKYEDYLCELFGTYRSTVVSSVIAIHSTGSTIGPSSYGRFNHLTTGESLYNFLMAWRLEVGITENNRKLLASMLTCLK